METNNKFEQELIDSSAYKNPEGRRVIDEAIARMRAAEKAGNAGEVEKITLELAEKLTKIAATPANTPPSPEDSEIVADLGKQFVDRFSELDMFDIFLKGLTVIVGINGVKYPAPSWNQVEASLTPDKLEKIKRLEHPILLLVPDGMPYRECLLKATADKIFLNKKKLSWHETDRVYLDGDKDGTLVSDVTQYDRTAHGGKTKTQRLLAPGALGWQVLVVDGGDEAPTDTLGRSADDLLADFRAKGFGGLSAEANLALQMHGQVSGKSFDEKWSRLLESYSTPLGTRGLVLVSYQHESSPAIAMEPPLTLVKGSLGARRSVRIL